MPPVEGALLEARQLTRSFGARRVLRGLDLSVAAGEVVLLLGQNGAGKSTLLRVLAGLMRPAAGEVRIRGRHLSPTDPESRRPIGWLSHQSLLYDDLSILENVTLAARLHGLPDPRQTAATALEEAGLGTRLDERPRRLSRGLLQRAAITRALIHRPAIILLDEPFTGLDAPAAERLAVRLSAEAKSGRALVLVTHHPAEAWEIASRVAVLSGGLLTLDAARPADFAVFNQSYGEMVRG